MPRGKNLVFLVSQPRAGSTMTQLVLSQAERIATTSEPWLQLLLLGLEDRLPRQKSNRTLHLPLIAFNELKNSLAKEEQISLCQEISHAVYSKFASEDQLFLDKTPRYFLILEELKRTYPEAKFILLKRDPEHVFRSIINTWHAGKSMGRVARGHYEDLFLAPQRIQDFLSQEKGNSNVLSVQYEDLISQDAETFQTLFDFLGVPFSPSYLNYGSSSLRGGDLGDPTGVKKHEKPSADTTRGDLSEKQGQYVKWYLDFLGANFLKSYGYEKEVSAETPPAQFQKFHDYGKAFSEKQGTLKEELKLALRYWSLVIGG